MIIIKLNNEDISYICFLKRKYEQNKDLSLSQFVNIKAKRSNEK